MQSYKSPLGHLNCISIPKNNKVLPQKLPFCRNIENFPAISWLPWQPVNQNMRLHLSIGLILKSPLTGHLNCISISKSNKVMPQKLPFFRNIEHFPAISWLPWQPVNQNMRLHLSIGLILKSLLIGHLDCISIPKSNKVMPQKPSIFQEY